MWTCGANITSFCVVVKEILTVLKKYRKRELGAGGGLNPRPAPCPGEAAPKDVYLKKRERERQREESTFVMVSGVASS
jgi:hypothetical protein